MQARRITRCVGVVHSPIPLLPVNEIAFKAKGLQVYAYVNATLLLGFIAVNVMDWK